MAGASDWGVDMDVAWDAFDRVEVFYRGKGIGKRTRRPWRKLWRQRGGERADVRPRRGHLQAAAAQAARRRRGHQERVPEAVQGHPADGHRDAPARRRGSGCRSSTGCKLGGSVTSSVGYVGWKLSTFPLGVLGGCRAAGSAAGAVHPARADRRVRVQDVVQLPGVAADVHAPTDPEPVLPEPRQQRRGDVPAARRGRGAGDRARRCWRTSTCGGTPATRAGRRRNWTTTSNSTWRSG